MDDLAARLEATLAMAHATLRQMEDLNRSFQARIRESHRLIADSHELLRRVTAQNHAAEQDESRGAAGMPARIRARAAERRRPLTI